MTYTITQVGSRLQALVLEGTGAVFSIAPRRPRVPGCPGGPSLAWRGAFLSPPRTMSDPLIRIERVLDLLCEALARWAKGGKPKPTEARHLWDIASQGRSEVRALQGAATRDHIPASVRRQVLARAGGRCENTGCANDAAHIDHIVPVARFSASTPDNLRALCARCNQRKGAA